MEKTNIYIIWKMLQVELYIIIFIFFCRKVTNVIKRETLFSSYNFTSEVSLLDIYASGGIFINMHLEDLCGARVGHYMCSN